MGFVSSFHLASYASLACTSHARKQTATLRNDIASTEHVPTKVSYLHPIQQLLRTTTHGTREEQHRIYFTPDTKSDHHTRTQENPRTTEDSDLINQIASYS
mmetsp:Transcript_21961/g.61160  ORF Transcript_21961/g.61160 Transcript_21961/m.61160 type:complete len:101 (-) Transcript_21961:899-1201(-)